MTERLSWGDWWLNLDKLTLEHGRDQEPYYVDLERLTSSAEVLDAVVQAGNRAGVQAVGHLVHALNDLLQFQENLCSGGASQSLSKASLRALVERRVREIPRERAGSDPLRPKFEQYGGAVRELGKPDPPA